MLNTRPRGGNEPGRRSGVGGSVRVQIVARNLLGSVIGILNVATVSPGTSWQAGPAILNLR